MKEFWRSKSRLLVPFLICWLYLLSSSFCWPLNEEGMALLKFKEQIVGDPYGALSNWDYKEGEESPCSWSGVECENGFVEVLNLTNLGLRGTLAPDIWNLVHVKFITLLNNSFSGVIPEEIANLSELEVLDLGYNNFNGPVPCNFRNNSSVVILLLENNELLDRTNSGLKNLSDIQVKEGVLSGPEDEGASSCNVWVVWAPRDAATQKSLELIGVKWLPYLFPPPFPLSPSSSPSWTPGSYPSPISDISPPLLPRPAGRSGTDHHRAIILSLSIGCPIFLVLLGIGIFVFKTGKVATVKPWVTGLSGQLQRAFVTGVPKLKRSELEAACEDFSNVIGSSSFCTLYKGTLSSGVEIAVASLAVVSSKNWSSGMESQFRKKIEMLSKVNHKNFVSLVGYCEEEDPFTRMMVFEYAPNGTLFEHLHIREAEHLDWIMRLRIAMGMAYCLDHMHQLTPPLPLRSLTSSHVYLTEDYAAKISDFVLWDEMAAADTEPNLSINVYSFGVVLFEMMTGRFPYSAGSDLLEDWASDYLRGEQPLGERVDPTLTTYDEDQLRRIEELIRACTDPEARRRPNMREVCVRLREITGIGPDGAIPKLSPLWWAELEIMSTEAT